MDNTRLEPPTIYRQQVNRGSNAVAVSSQLEEKTKKIKIISDLFFFSSLRVVYGCM